MIVKRLNENNQDKDKRNFKILDICCTRMGRELGECPIWSVYNDEIWASDGEDSIGGKYCCYCGQRIIIFN